MSNSLERAGEIQREAADPKRSIVLEAAAGSGKTKVLVDRFLRLCLSGEKTDARSVLAITFTRKATIEIVARLQRAARRLASAEPAKRRAALEAILGRKPTNEEVERAAWFHESLLEDPNSLGIATIHAFCQKLLGRFAAEAGLDPRMSLLDDRQEADYRDQALDRLEHELGADPAAAAAYVGLAGSALGARKRIAQLFLRRMHLQRWLDSVAPPTGPLAAAHARPLAAETEALVADLAADLLRGTPWEGTVNPDPTMLAIPLATALRELAGAGLAAVAAVDEPLGLTPGFKKQQAELTDGALVVASRLEAAPDTVRAGVAAVQDLLLTKGDKLRSIRGKNDTKAERQTAFLHAAQPVLTHLQQLALVDLLALNRTLLACGLRALDLYAAAKRNDRVVDFQDLEYLAVRLLHDDDIGNQVHYRLDARIDHLLLDEFQDTNRNQWELLTPLLEEILAGSDPPRTAFVVGDVKQSIYGFRGADPSVFGIAHALIAKSAGADPHRVLPTNFRSLPAVVEAVGKLFQREPLAGYLGAEATGARQDKARNVVRGEVAFLEPFQAEGGRSGHDRAADTLVALIRRLLANDCTWTVNPLTRHEAERSLRHDDILVLSRTKTHLASYEAALRRAGIPYTPAGRGLLARSREVQDILALLRWLTVPADDIAGATVLRSPCFRVPEAVVQELLQARLGKPRRSLREILPAKAADYGLEAVAERLGGWFDLAGRLPLHDLLRRVVREGELLARFETAGGEQARFNLLRLMDLALAADARGGTLRDFVDELDQADRRGGEEEGTLPGESGTGRVQVMTVHGAKGLEAPVVILVDAAASLREQPDTLLLGERGDDGPWVSGVGRYLTDGPRLTDGTPVGGPLTTVRDAARATMMSEEAHILYVAMTRARDRLFVLGGLNQRQSAREAERSFLGWLRAATDPNDETLWPSADELTATDGETATTVPPATHDEFARRAVSRLQAWSPPPLAPQVELVNPSSLEATAPSASDATTTRPVHDLQATERGTQIHRWLERACRLGEVPPDDPEPAEIAAEARAVYTHPDLAWVFHPADLGGRGLSEVPVVHCLPDTDPERRVVGTIDRLVIRPDRIDIVDYKSDRFAPADLKPQVAHHRPQLLAYRDALAVIYPDREIRCWLVWTHPTATTGEAAVSEVVS